MLIKPVFTLSISSNKLKGTETQRHVLFYIKNNVNKEIAGSKECSPKAYCL